MPSSELLNDLTSEPISRRTLAAGLWAAPVIALTVAAPAVAASIATVTVSAQACNANVSVVFRVTNTGSVALPAGTAFSVTPPAGLTVSSVSGGSGSGSNITLPALAVGAFVDLTVNLSGTPSNSGSSVAATVSGSNLTGTLAASRRVQKQGGNAAGWACA